jgi:hypothetical protein
MSVLLTATSGSRKKCHWAQSHQKKRDELWRHIISPPFSFSFFIFLPFSRIIRQEKEEATVRVAYGISSTPVARFY